MAGRYSSDQLLKLRDSPLVAKPTSLPPVEEWMGPPVDATQKRANSSNTKAEPTSRFNQKLGNGGVLSSTKTPFSATFKSGTTPFESPSRSAFGNFGAGTPRDEYFPKGRYVRSGDEGADERGGSRPRRGESWSATQDEDDRGGRRGIGRDNDHDLKDGRRQRGFEATRRDGTDENRRNGTGRAERSSWLRDDDPPEGRTREGARSGGWRDSAPRRGQGRDWHADDRDAEPEWMGSDDRSGGQARTVQDIEKWKASMRARDQGSAPPESGESSNQHSRRASQAASTKPKAETPLMLDPSVDDKFFGILGGPRAASSGAKGDGGSNLPKPAKASKFSGFFGPQTPASATEAIAPPPPPPPAMNQPPVPLADDDKAGFQRILAMLAGPHGGVPLQDGALSSQSAPPRRSTPPPNDNATLHTTHSPPPIISPRSRRPGALENLLGMQSPREGGMQPNAPNASNAPNAPTNKDADFLLNLLKSRDAEAQQAKQAQQHGNVHANVPPGLYGAPPGSGEEHARPGSGDGGGPGGRGMFDDFHRPQHGRPTHGGVHEGPGPEGTHHHPPAHHMHHHPHEMQHPSYDDEQHHQHDRGNYPPYPHMGMPPHPPPGLQRPPGFEHMPPPMPGFPPFMNQPPRPPGEMLRAPPGLGGGGRPPGGFPPGLVPQMGGLGLGDERGGEGRDGSTGPGGPQPPHFGPGGGPPGPGGPRGPPPGFGPGPGPNGMPLPPRGFPPLHPGMDGFPIGPPGPHGGQHPPPGRMMDMFDGYGGGRGGPPPPGQGQGGGVSAPPPGFERR